MIIFCIKLQFRHNFTIIYRNLIIVAMIPVPKLYICTNVKDCNKKDQAINIIKSIVLINHTPKILIWINYQGELCPVMIFTCRKENNPSLHDNLYNQLNWFTFYIILPQLTVENQFAYDTIKYYHGGGPFAYCARDIIMCTTIPQYNDEHEIRYWDSRTPLFNYGVSLDNTLFTACPIAEVIDELVEMLSLIKLNIGESEIMD